MSYRNADLRLQRILSETPDGVTNLLLGKLTRPITKITVDVLNYVLGFCFLCELPLAEALL